MAITSPVAAGNIINQSEVSAGFIISGTATAGNVPVNGQTAMVAIVDSSNVVKYTYTTTVTNGAWSVKVPAAQALALTDGNYSIRATVLDTAGNTTTTVTQTITVDTVPPTVTISTTDTTTNQPTQKISGHVTTTEAAAGGTVTLYDTVNGVTTQVGTATVGSDGAWSHQRDAVRQRHPQHRGPGYRCGRQHRGQHACRVYADIRPPRRSRSRRPVAGDNIINKAEAAAGVTISGTATAGSGGAAVNGQTATITIVDSTNAVKDTYTATVTGGAWSVNVTAAQAQALADGSYTIKANVSDAAGNAATTATQAITVDETAPTIAITTPVAGDNIINKAEAAAGVTISGTATAGRGAAVNGQTATITIVDSTNAVKDTYTTTVTGGTWSVNVTAAQAQALADGSYTIKANVSDAAGNAATTATQAITVDETTPDDCDHDPGRRRQHHQQGRGGRRRHHQRHGHGRQRRCSGQRPDRDDHDRRQHQRGQGHLYGDGDGRRLVGQRDGGAGAGPGRRQLQHQGQRLGCRRQCGDHRDARPSRWTRPRPTIAITTPVAGDNIINKTEAAAGVTISGTATAARRCGSQRPDRDDHDRRQHQRRQGHLYDDGDGRRLVGERDGGAGAGPGRRQLQHQGQRLRCRRQCGDHRDPGDHGRRDRARRSRSRPRSPATTSSTRPRRPPASPSAARPRPAAQRSTARPRRSRSSTAPTRSRTPIRRR